MKSYFHWLSTIRKIPNFSQWRPFYFCSNIKIKQNFACQLPDMCSLGSNYVKKRGWRSLTFCRPCMINVKFRHLSINAHCMYPKREQSAVQSLFALEARCAFATTGNCDVSMRWQSPWSLPCLYFYWGKRGGGPRVVVSTAAFHARVRGFGSRSRRFERNKNVSSPSTCES